MRRRPPVLLFGSLWLIATAACGPQPDLATDLKFAPTISGYYDDGITPAKMNRILPSITFQLKNEGKLPITNVDLGVAFWQTGADGEARPKQIRGIGSAALEPGATSETMTVRSTVGYTHEGPRADMFTNSPSTKVSSSRFSPSGPERPRGLVNSRLRRACCRRSPKTAAIRERAAAHVNQPGHMKAPRCIGG